MDIYTFIAQQISKGRGAYEQLIRDIQNEFGKKMNKVSLHTAISRMNNNESVRAKLPKNLKHIKYNRQEKRYEFDGEGVLPPQELEENEIKAIALAKNFMRMVENQGGIFDEFNSAINTVLKKFEEEKGIHSQDLNFIEFEKMPNLEGNRYLGEIVEYIQQRQVIEISYKEFFDDRAKSYLVLPIILRVYDFRWYLIGLSVVKKNNEFVINWKNGEYKPFGLYYLQSAPKPVNRPHNPPDTEEMLCRINELYDNVSGITLGWDNPEGYQIYKDKEKIIVRFRKPQEQYALSSNLGKHMKPLNDNDPMYARYELNMIPTYELMMRLLAWNYFVEIVEPEYLRKDFKYILQKNLKLYD